MKKLSPHAYTRFFGVHTWAGVVCGLVLHLMFLFGSITLFHEQLWIWEEPLAQRFRGEESVSALLEAGFAKLTPEESAKSVWLYPPRHEYGVPQIQFEEKDGEWREMWFDTETRQLVPKREVLRSFLYGLHFLWHDLTGDWLYYSAGFLGVSLLLALVTGVLIHVKDLMRQFYRFRAEKAPRVWSSDLHKVLGVVGLPFQAMYAYTGAAIILSPLLLKGLTGPVFGGDQKRAEAALFGASREQEPEPGGTVTALGFEQLISRAQAEIPRIEVATLAVHHRGRKHGSVDVYGLGPGTPQAHVEMRLDAETGRVLRTESPGNAKPPAKLQHWVHGLHFANFGGITLRWLFFVLGLLGCATILSGNWIWLNRRSSQQQEPGYNALSRLTAGVGVGSVVAVAALFLASRALPLEWSGRTTAEQLTFLGVLLGCALWAFSVRNEAALWWQGSLLSALLFLPVPLFAARWSSAGLFGGGPRIASVVGVDLTLLFTACALAAAGWGLSRKDKKT